MNETKRCSRCGKTQPLKEYHFKKRKYNIRNDVCRSCMMKSRAKNGERIGFFPPGDRRNKCKLPREVLERLVAESKKK